MNENRETTAWPDFAIALFDLLSGRKAELTWDSRTWRFTFPSLPERIQSMLCGNSMAC
jgi:hypothetical protein